MRPLILHTLLAFSLTGTISAGPALSSNAYDSVKIMSPASKEIARSSDPDTITFLLAAMKRAKSAGSNTHGLSLTTILHFSSPNSTSPVEDAKASLKEVSSYYIDLNSGHFALVSPPKLALYQFSKDDLASLKKKLKITAEATSASDGKPAK